MLASVGTNTDVCTGGSGILEVSGAVHPFFSFVQPAALSSVPAVLPFVLL